MRRTPCIALSLVLVCAIPSTIAETSTPNTGDQVQSFLFGFTESNLVTPVTASCPTPLTLTKLTTTNAKTSDSAAPYTMVMLVHEQLIDGSGRQYERLYSASMNVGDMSQTTQVNHPWMNGTQFIACIWGSNGASGGCQDLYTVVPNEETFDAYNTPNQGCRADHLVESWVPPGNETLDVAVTGVSGAVSWNAWPAACSDLQITPKNGTAPYTLVVAPASHPPVNITSASSGDITLNYTVRLTHGQAFMLGLYDSNGASWAFGPLHAGESDDLTCLATATGQQGTTKKSGEGVSVGAFAGTVVGAFVVGAIGALFLAWLFMLRKRSPKKSPSEDDLYANPRPVSYDAANSLYNKPLGTPSNIYTDSPPLEFDTPATLYDPHVSGPLPQAYPKPPSHRHTTSNERVFPRPPHDGDRFANPYENEDGYSYRDSINLSDFRPGPTPLVGASSGSSSHPGTARGGSGNRRESVTSMNQDSPGLGLGSGQGYASGHAQDPSWTSSVGSSRTAVRKSQGQSPGPGPPTTGYGMPHNPSSPRPASFGSTHTRTGPTGPSSGGNIGEGDGNGDLSPPSSPTNGGRGPRKVYIVHSDGGGRDVHIQLPDDDSTVIELPPNYRQMDDPGPGLGANASPRPMGAATSPLPSPSLSTRMQYSPPIHGQTPQQGHSPGLGNNSPYLGLEPTRSRNSGLSTSGLSGRTTTTEMGPEELRARAEAAMREKTARPPRVVS
ncbi:hypothetical protein I317_00367 [Kwoniella heveanensis CBS 569]|nr:hypothetical protein I317_00367 [Kwoniella heveanensis CBS 569]